jgi:branched-chain amino acid transport system permease protein
VIFLNQLLQGVFLGGYYAMIACSLSFLFGVMRIVNLAHGGIVVLSAFLLFVLADRFAMSPFLALIAVVPVMAGLGWLLQRLVLDRGLRGGPLVPLLATFGLAIVLDNALFETFGADTRSLSPAIGDLSYDSWTITDDISIGKLDVLILASAIAMLGALDLLLTRTRIGRAIRATAEDPGTVGLIGIDARAVYAMATALALAMAAVAGAFLAMRASFDPYTGGAQLIFAFEAVVIGGFGSLWGTLWGGIVLGVAQNVGAAIAPSGFFIAGHVTFLVVLVGRVAAGGDFSNFLARRRGMP